MIFVIGSISGKGRSVVKISRLANWKYTMRPYQQRVANSIIIVKNIRKKRRGLYNTSKRGPYLSAMPSGLRIWWCCHPWAFEGSAAGLKPVLVAISLVDFFRPWSLERGRMSTTRSGGEVTPWSVTCDILNCLRLPTAVLVGVGMKQFQGVFSHRTVCRDDCDG